jgi:hypothetical protein
MPIQGFCCPSTSPWRRFHAAGLTAFLLRWFLWDKRRSLWIAAEDCPDGEQFEEAELGVLLARLSAINAECR